MVADQRALRFFATPVVVATVEGADELNAELEKAIRDRMAQTKGVIKSNFGGWHSETDLLDWTGEAGRRVVAAAIELANANTVSAKGKPVSPAWRVAGWANVSGPRDAHVVHIHPAAYWSAVYYVRIGASSGGRLQLHDPRMPALRMHAPWLMFKANGPEGKARIEPAEGQLVLFPSWLSHSVEPWDGDSERISIAINLTAPLPGRRQADDTEVR
jgi:uncharacterized protein (TIGR02466 family)